MTDRITKQAIEFKLNQLETRSVDVPQYFAEDVTMAKAATITGPLTVAGLVTLSSNVDMTNIPTSDPSVAGRLWANTGVLTVSSG